jgi:CheY-like chemotaxis protein
MSFPPQFDATLTTSARSTVLLVEDDRATREMFDYALRIAGFDVSSAADGLSALRAIDQHFIPDVIVLDLDLPQVSGIDVHQEIVSHAETRAIPIIVVTGTTWPPPPGVFRTLRKPINSDVLVRVVQHAVEQQHKQPAVSDPRHRAADD